VSKLHSVANHDDDMTPQRSWTGLRSRATTRTAFADDTTRTAIMDAPRRTTVTANPRTTVTANLHVALRQRPLSFNGGRVRRGTVTMRPVVITATYDKYRSKEETDAFTSSTPLGPTDTSSKRRLAHDGFNTTAGGQFTIVHSRRPNNMKPPSRGTSR
jgi:hypothetical protein